MNTNNDNAFGTLRISRDVLATIAKSAAVEVAGINGIAGIASDFKGIFSKGQSVKPVLVEIEDDIAQITLHVNIDGGCKIPSVTEKVQKSVKEAVQSMTGITVSKVNVIIEGVRFAESAGA